MNKKKLDYKKFNGILVVNKPVGMISKDVSRVITKQLGKLKIGHVGTLDPLASGVLPILFGAATKAQDYLLDSEKVYDLDIEFGYQTTTLDLEGDIQTRKPVPKLTETQIENILKEFIGEIDQIPPIYSAVKYKGKPLYEYARAGNESLVPLEELKRTIKIYEISLLEFAQNKISLRVSCSKGTYVRVLARDLALRLNTCGTMTKLERVCSSGFSLDQCNNLDEVKEGFEDFQQLLLPLEKANFSMPYWLIPSSEVENTLGNGRVLHLVRREFEQNLGQNQSLYRPNARENDMFLLDCSGKAFGIGTVKTGTEGMINIKLKRGLR